MCITRVLTEFGPPWKRLFLPQRRSHRNRRRTSDSARITRRSRAYSISIVSSQVFFLALLDCSRPNSSKRVEPSPFHPARDSPRGVPPTDERHGQKLQACPRLTRNRVWQLCPHKRTCAVGCGERQLATPDAHLCIRKRRSVTPCTSADLDPDPFPAHLTRRRPSLRHRHENEPNMNLRRATVDDLMGMQNCNLHNLPEVRRFLVLSERAWH